MKWRRDRTSRPTLSQDEIRAVWQSASLLLEYPDDELVGRSPALRAALAAVPHPHPGMTRLLDDLESTDLGVLQAEYVDTFDVTRRCALHLTYFTHGDTRRRGVALIEFKQAYRRARVEMGDAELPDYLPALLEFGACHDLDIAWKLLNDHRVGIELLHRGLAARGSRWTGLLEALRDTLPQLDGTDEEALQRLIAEGPPSEQVGLEPYALDPRLNPRPEPVDLGASIPVGAVT